MKTTEEILEYVDREIERLGKRMDEDYLRSKNLDSMKIYQQDTLEDVRLFIISE